MRLFLTIILLTLMGHNVAARDFSLTGLRAAITDGDFDRVDAGLQRAQAEFLSGTRSADEIRALYIGLSRSAPDTKAFVKAWLDKDPENPRAQIARAWSLFEAAGHVRRGNNGYSDFMAQTMYTESSALASKAYRQAPYLLPVSDALVRGLGRSDIEDVGPNDVLTGVLLTHPNWGTVQRAILTRDFSTKLGIFRPRFCNAVATFFPKADATALRHRCMMYVGAYRGGFVYDRYIAKHLWTDKSPETVEQRLAYFIQKTDLSRATTAQLDWALKTLMTHPVDQYQMVFFAHLARRLLNNPVLISHGFEFGYHDFKAARLAEVEGFLEHDPLNLDLLDLAEGVAFVPEFKRVSPTASLGRFERVKVFGDDDIRQKRNADRMAQSLDFSKRRIQAAPYSAEGWVTLAEMLSRQNGPLSMLDGDLAYQNAIFYADDPVSVLTIFIHRKMLQWETLDFLTGQTSKQRPAAAPVKAAFAEVDRDAHVVCPLFRAELVRKHLCDQAPNRPDACGPGAVPNDQNLSIYVEVARNTPACRGLAQRSLEELWYTPTPYAQAVTGLMSEKTQ